MHSVIGKGGPGLRFISPFTKVVKYNYAVTVILVGSKNGLSPGSFTPSLTVKKNLGKSFIPTFLNTLFPSFISSV